MQHAAGIGQVTQRHGGADAVEVPTCIEEAVPLFVRHR